MYKVNAISVIGGNYIFKQNNIELFINPRYHFRDIENFVSNIYVIEIVQHAAHHQVSTLY